MVAPPQIAIVGCGRLIRRVVPQGQEMADLAAIGRVNLGIFDTRVFPLDHINAALAELKFGTGGFTNFVISPEL